MIYRWPDWSRLQMSGWQRGLLLDDSKRKILVAGRGAGKSWVIVLDALLQAHDVFADRPADFARPGPRVVVWFVAPNLQNLHDLWAAVKSLSPKVPGRTREGEKRYHVNENSHTVWLYGQSRGIEIRLISAWLPNSMRSASVDIMVCDEWAFAGYSVEKRRVIAGLGKGGDEVWDSILEKCVNRAFCSGQVTIASTPFSNYFDDWCHQALMGEGQFGDWSFHHAKWSDNAFLTAEQRNEIEAERQKNIYKFAQEREAQLHVVFPRFTSQDRAFGDGLIDGLLVDRLPGVSRGPYAAGVDISWLGPDWLVVWVVDLQTNILVHCEMHAKTELLDILAILERVHGTWKLRRGRLGYDATGEGKSLRKVLPEDWGAEEVYFWDQQKAHLVSNVHLRMERGALRMPNPETFDFSTLPHWNDVDEQNQKANFEQALKELRDYRRREDTLANGEKRVRYMKGEIEKRDDCVDGLSVVCHVMPPLPLDVRPKADKRTLAQKFNRAWGGG